jgi:hypothetical protein
MIPIKLIIDIQKIWAWCKAHWKWLALGTAGLVLYCMGRRQGKNLLIAAEAARDQYLKDKEAIESNAAKKTKRNEKAVKAYHKTTELLKEERDEEVEEIGGMTTEDVLDDLGIEKI